MADILADIQTAFETVLGALPFSAGVFNDLPDSDPPIGKVMFEVGFVSEKYSEFGRAAYGDAGASNRSPVIAVYMKGAVPRDFTKAAFEADIVGPTKVAIATSPEIAATCDVIQPDEAHWVRTKEESTPCTIRAQFFRLPLTTPNDAPGRRI